MSYNDKAPARSGGLDEHVHQPEEQPHGSTLGTRIHLPRNRKSPPPAGVTGWKNLRARESYAFPADHDGNVGLVLADGIVMIDVDQYDGKHGVETMRARVQEWGPLPDTWMNTRRDPETGGGHYMFRVPVGTRLQGDVGAGVEILQAGHRYAVIAPSVVDGQAYRWYGPDLQPCAEPDADDLPELPSEWLDGLRNGAQPELLDVVEFADDTGALEWLEATVHGFHEPMTPALRRVLDKLSDDAIGGAHDAMNDAVHEIVALGAESHEGTGIALEQARKMFCMEVLGGNDGEARRDLASADAEWTRSLTGAIAKLRAELDSGHRQISRLSMSAASFEVDLAVFRETTLAQAIRSIRTVDATEFENSDTGHARMFLACMGDLVQAIDGGEWALWDQAAGRLIQVKAPELSGRAWEASVKASITETAKTVRAAALNVADEDEQARLEKRAEELDRRDTTCGNRRVIDPSIDLAHRFSRKIDPQTLDADRLTMGMPDGVLDLRNPHDPMRRGRPEDLILMQAGTTYDREASSPLFDDYLDTFIPDLELRRYVQKVLGYAAITGGNPLRIMVWLKGGTSTGKTTMIEAMQAGLGDYGGTIDVNALLRQKRDGGPMPEVLAAMMRRAVFASEVGHHNRLHADVIKRLTGGDTVTARALYSNKMIERTPMFTPVIATNDAPTIEDADAALARRIIVLPFEQSVSPPDNLEDQPPALKDDPEAVRALFAWLVEGALMAQQEGLHNDMPTAAIDARREFLASVNPFREWCDRTFDEAPADALREEQANATTAWEAWSRAVCIDPELKKIAPTRKAFSALMQGVYGPVDKRSRKVLVDGQMKDRYFYQTPIVLRGNTESE